MSKYKYGIRDDDKAEQLAFLSTLYQTYIDGMLEYCSNVIRGEGLFVKTKLDTDKAIEIINSNFAIYGIPTADSGVVKMVKELGTLGYYNHRTKEVQYLMWYPGQTDMPSVDKILQEVRTHCSDHTPPTLADITWNIQVSHHIPREYIAEYKLYPFLRHVKSHALMLAKFRRWKYNVVTLENATLVNRLNSGKVARVLRGKS